MNGANRHYRRRRINRHAAAVEMIQATTPSTLG